MLPILGAVGVTLVIKQEQCGRSPTMKECTGVGQAGSRKSIGGSLD